MRQSSSSRFCVEVREPQESLPGQQKLDSRFCVEVPRASVGVDWQLDSTTTDGFIGTVASGTTSVVKKVASGTTSVVKKVASGTTSVVGTVRVNAAKAVNAVKAVSIKKSDGSKLRVNFIDSSNVSTWENIDKERIFRGLEDSIRTNETYEEVFVVVKDSSGIVRKITPPITINQGHGKSNFYLFGIDFENACELAIAHAEVEKPREIWLQVMTFFPTIRLKIVRPDCPPKWYDIDNRSKNIYKEIESEFPSLAFYFTHVMVYAKMNNKDKDAGLIEALKIEKGDFIPGFNAACKLAIARVEAQRPLEYWLQVNAVRR